tara:strand:+ start:203 stop:601 length:399 start_codon:yes stop_codon:yes gene_type:complete
MTGYLLVLHILNLLIYSFFLTRIFFFIEGIHLEYKTHKTATYLWQFTGVTMLPLLLFGIYIFFREGGINGTWIYFNLLFISSLFQFILELLVYFKIIYKDLGVKNSIIDLLAFGYLTISSAILITGLSSQIY